MHAHMLVQIVVSAEYLAATGMGALVRFIMCVNAANVPLEMLSTLETLAADLAQVCPPLDTRCTPFTARQLCRGDVRSCHRLFSRTRAAHDTQLTSL